MSPEAEPVEGASLHVLVLTDYFPPHLGGGVERAAYEVSRRAVAAGHKVTVITTNSDHAPAHELMDGLDVIRVPAFDLTRLTGIQLAVSLPAWLAIRRQLNAGDVDVVHVHSLFFHLALAGAVLSKAYRVPLVATMHVGALTSLGGAYSRLSTLYERVVGRGILSLSSQVIAVSRAVAEHARSLGVEAAKTTVIANGVDMQRFSPAAAEASRPQRVLIVGRLIFNKGPQFLVDAMPAILQRFPATEFWFVGDGPMRHDLEAAVRENGTAHSATFFGDREDVPQLLQQGDVLVRPSLLEGMPLTVLEAMATGLPVVATPVGGTAEVVQDGVTGYLVEPGDVESLADCICRLLADPALRQRLGAAGRSVVKQGYSWDEISRRTVEVYRRAIPRRALAPLPDVATVPTSTAPKHVA